MIVSKGALLGLCAILVKMRTTPKPRRAPDVGTDEDLNDGSNNGAELQYAWIHDEGSLEMVTMIVWALM